MKTPKETAKIIADKITRRPYHVVISNKILREISGRKFIRYEFIRSLSIELEKIGYLVQNHIDDCIIVHVNTIQRINYEELTSISISERYTTIPTQYKDLGEYILDLRFEDYIWKTKIRLPGGSKVNIPLVHEIIMESEGIVSERLIYLSDFKTIKKE